MSDNEFDIDYKWKAGQLEKEKDELVQENKRLHLEISTLHIAIKNLFERISKVSSNWFPPFANENPRYHSLSKEGAFGTFNSVVTLCKRDPSLLKKFSSQIPLFIVDFLLFMVPLKRTKLRSSIFFFQRDPTQRPRAKTDTNSLHYLEVQKRAHLNQPNFSSNRGLISTIQ
jgi:hypothetical protein